MDESAKNEIEKLKRDVESLSKRIRELEERVAAESAPPVESPVESPTESPLESPGESPAAAHLPPPIPGSLRWQREHAHEVQSGTEGDEKVHTSPAGNEPKAVAARGAVNIVFSNEPTTNIHKQGASGSTNDAPSGSGNLEARIGTVWLNRLGIASLVIGLAFLIAYSFQYFGAGIKIATGLTIAAILIGIGEMQERRRSMRWYGRGLIGGGWSLAYFTVYAMHHVAAVKVLGDPTIDAVLLFVVAAGAMAHSIVREAEVIATLAIVLATVTMSLMPVAGFTVASAAIIASLVSILSAKQKWQSLLLSGAISSYLTLLFTYESDAMRNLVLPFASGGLLLTCYVAAVYGIASVKAAEPSKRAAAATAAALLNAICFVFALTAYGEGSKAAANILVLVAALSSFGLAYWAKNLGAGSVAAAHSWAGLILGTVLIPRTFDESSLALAIEGMEVAGLVYLGLKNDYPSFRRFAHILAFITFFGGLMLWSDSAGINVGPVFVYKTILTMGIIAASLGAAAAFYRLYGADERARNLYATYLLASTVLFWAIVEKQFSDGPQVVMWLAMAGVLAWLGGRTKEIYARVYASAVLFSACALCALNSSQIPWPASTLAVATTLFMAITARSGALGFPRNPKLFYFEGIMGIGTAFVLCGASNIPYLSLLFAGLCGATLVWAGIALGDRVTRVFGCVWLTVAGIWLIFDDPSTPWWVAALVVSALFGSAGMYLSWKDKPDVEENAGDSLFVWAAIVLTLLLGNRVHAHWLTLAWAAEGAAFLAAGFKLPNKALRVCGLSVFALLVGKLLFVDLSGADTLYRILSFIGAGIALLGGSYFYGLYAGKALQEAELTEAAGQSAPPPESPQVNEEVRREPPAESSEQPPSVL